MMPRKALIGLLVLPAAWSAICSAAQRDYAVIQRSALQQDKHGVDGELQVLADSRLTAAVRDQMWGVGDWAFVLPPGSKPFNRFSELPPGNAKLQIRNAAGKLIAEREFERPLARFEEFPAAGGNIFLLTVDYSMGFGSYAGPQTTLLQVSGAAFHDVDAVDSDTQQPKPIRLMKSLKSGWQMTKDSAAPEILSLTCRPGTPGPGGPTFVLTYTRYSFDGKQWLVYERQIDGGFWESTEPFPQRVDFP